MALALGAAAHRRGMERWKGSLFLSDGKAKGSQSVLGEGCNVGCWLLSAHPNWENPVKKVQLPGRRTT